MTDATARPVDEAKLNEFVGRMPASGNDDGHIVAVVLEPYRTSGRGKNLLGRRDAGSAKFLDDDTQQIPRFRLRIKRSHFGGS